MSDVIIRTARPGDYDDLLEIGDVYYGNDYLKDHYFSFFDDPVIYPLVAEVDGKAVGFYMNHIIDDGQTLIKRAGRVNPSYRGKGIFHKLSMELDKHRETFWPDVRFEVFGTTNLADRAANEFQEKGFLEVVRKRFVNLHVRVKDLKGLDISQDQSRVTKMTYDDVKLLFANDEVVNRLVPKGVLFNWFMGYKILDDNIKYIINDMAFVLASTSPSSPSALQFSSAESEGKNSDNFTQQSIKNIEVLSCAHKHVGILGLSYEIDFYTADGYDKSAIKTHLIKHLQDFSQSTKEDGIILISFNSNVHEDLLLSSLEEFGIIEFVPNMENHKVFYERNL